MAELEAALYAAICASAPAAARDGGARVVVEAVDYAAGTLTVRGVEAPLPLEPAVRAQLAELERLKERRSAHSMGDFLELMWDMSVLDVEKTLRHACKKLLSDSAVSKDVRRRRALGVRLLAQLLIDAVPPESRAAGMRSAMNEMMGQSYGAGAHTGADADGADDAAEEEEEEGGGTGAGATPAHTAPARRTYTEQEASALTAKELKAVLRERGVSTEQAVEKADLVRLVLESQP